MKRLFPQFNTSRACAILAGMCLISSSYSFAADGTWTGGTSTIYTLGTNWNTGSAPNNTDLAIFTGTVTANQPNYSSGTTRLTGGFVFSTPTGGWTLVSSSTGTFQLGTSGITTAGQISGNNTIAPKILLAVGSVASPAAAAQTWQVGTGGTLTVSGSLSDVVGSTLTVGTVANAGTLVFTGSSTRVSATNINAGTLLINADQSGATGTFTVGATAVLGGNGTVGGAVSVSASGTLAPGTQSDSTATLALANQNLILSSADSKIALDIAGTGAGSFDKVAGINTFSLDGDVTITLTGSYTSGDSWDLFDFTSKTGNFDSITLTGSYVGTLSRVGDIWSNGDIGGNSWQFDQTTGVLTAVPEPQTWALFALGAVAVLWRGKSRRVFI